MAGRVRRVAQPAAATVAAIGGRLRSARQARGLTLQEVADATGLNKGFISRLERDEVSPSVASLVSVCEVLGIRVGDLFEPPSTSLVRANEGKPINFGGRKVREFLLTPGTQSDLQVIHSILKAGGSGGEELYTLDCEVEFVYVIRGQLEVSVSGESVLLTAGDAFTFPGREPHTWSNPCKDEECEVCSGYLRPLHDPAGAAASAGVHPVGLVKSSPQVGMAERSRLGPCPRDHLAALHGGPPAAVLPRGAAAPRHGQGRRVA